MPAQVIQHEPIVITNEASPQTDEMYFGGRSVLVDNPRGVGSGRAGNW
jgi:hypothetical protein